MDKFEGESSEKLLLSIFDGIFFHPEAKLSWALGRDANYLADESSFGELNKHFFRPCLAT